MDDDIIIKFPLADISTYISMTIFIIIIVVVYFIALRYVKKRESKKAKWNIVLGFLLRHDLAIRESNIIQEFYQSLDEKTQEEIITSTRKFHKMLNEYFSEKSNIEAETRVNILEKLFPVSSRLHEVKTLEDLFIGEVCAVEFEDKKFMGTLVKKNTDELLISFEEFPASLPDRGASAGIYVFRPHIGGFLLSGSTKEIGPDFIIFKFNAKVEQKSGHHLMAEIISTALFKPWPLPKAGDKNATHEIQAETCLFSDRAIIFTAKNEEDIHYYLNRHDIWSVSTKLPGGYHFTCRGTITQSKNYDKKFIFRFLDAPEVARNILFVEIKEHNPVEEHIG